MFVKRVRSIAVNNKEDDEDENTSDTNDDELFNVWFDGGGNIEGLAILS